MTAQRITAWDLLGIAPDFTGDLSTDEYMRQVRRRDDEQAPALCASGCGSPVAWEGACCDPCDSDAADAVDRDRARHRP